MIFLVFVINFLISWFNAWSVGKTWNESKHNGGWPHFMNWMGAVMSACGFTWCYLLIIGLVCANVQITHEDGTVAAILSQGALQAFFDLGYMVIVLPIIGSGMAITVHSWGVFYRRRTLANGAIAGWNTFANVYNVVSAARHIPVASKGLWSFFKGEDKNAQAIVVGLVLIALVGGCATTYAIVTRTARKTANNRAFDYMQRAEAERQ